MSRIQINKEHTAYIKGIGILLIMFHNYFHWLAPKTGENEFIFDPQNIQNLFTALSDSYFESVNVLFSYFGHYGVQLFVFISGYGLAKSYFFKQDNFPIFINKRINKIYPTFLIALTILITYKTLTGYAVDNIGWITSVFIKIMMLHTFLPNEALSISGPWWFYGMIIQLYLIFIPLVYIIKKWKWKGFLLTLVGSYLIIFLLYNPLMDKNIFIMANAPGHIPEFALGIFIALTPTFTIKFWQKLLLIALFVLGNFYFSLFPFTFIIVTYFLLEATLKIFRKDLFITSIIKFYGELSMFLFAIHGFLRSPFVEWAKTTNNPISAMYISVLYILTVTVLAFLFKEAYYLAKRTIQRVYDPQLLSSNLSSDT